MNYTKVVTETLFFPDYTNPFSEPERKRGNLTTGSSYQYSISLI